MFAIRSTELKFYRKYCINNRGKDGLLSCNCKSASPGTLQASGGVTDRFSHASDQQRPTRQGKFVQYRGLVEVGCMGWTRQWWVGRGHIGPGGTGSRAVAYTKSYPFPHLICLHGSTRICRNNITCSSPNWPIAAAGVYPGARGQMSPWGNLQQLKIPPWDTVLAVPAIQGLRLGLQASYT